MPYIDQESRKSYDKLICKLVNKISKTCNGPTEAAGVLNYCVSQLCLQVYSNVVGKLKYWHIALICGILTNVKDEFYRRKAVPYENIKIRDNGDLELYEAETK